MQRKKIAIEMQPAIKPKKFGLAMALDFDLSISMYFYAVSSLDYTTLPAEVENNLKFPLHMDYLVLF